MINKITVPNQADRIKIINRRTSHWETNFHVVSLFYISQEKLLYER